MDDMNKTEEQCSVVLCERLIVFFSLGWPKPLGHKHIKLVTLNVADRRIGLIYP